MDDSIQIKPIKILIYSIDTTSAWTQDGDDYWKWGTPVMRRPQGSWDTITDNTQQKLWLAPKLFGGADPDELNFEEWLQCYWDNQAGRWVVIASNSLDSVSSSMVSDVFSESDKSTAIVPASWTPGGYTALFTLESPEVRFDDLMTVTMTGVSKIVQIDRQYVEVCEPGTITVCGAIPDAPIVVGAKIIDDDTLYVMLDRNHDGMVTVSIRLTAIRRGFAGKRLPNRTQEQFVANEKTLRSAYPGAGQ